FPGGMAIERIAGLLEVDVLRQHDGELVMRHRLRAAFIAVDDRDGRAPITLARHAPVPQTVLNRSLAPARLLGTADDFGCSLLGRQPVRKRELTAIPGAFSASSPMGSSAFPGALATTRRIGRWYCFANSKSRWSCPGTPKIAPV